MDMQQKLSAQIQHSEGLEKELQLEQKRVQDMDRVAQEAIFYRKKDEEKAQEREKQLAKEVQMHRSEKDGLFERIEDLQNQL